MATDMFCDSGKTVTIGQLKDEENLFKCSTKPLLYIIQVDLGPKQEVLFT